MIEFTDPFDKKVILEILPAIYNKRISFITRRERQTIYESWDLETARKVLEALDKTVRVMDKTMQMIEASNENKDNGDIK